MPEPLRLRSHLIKKKDDAKWREWIKETGGKPHELLKLVMNDKIGMNFRARALLILLLLHKSLSPITWPDGAYGLMKFNCIREVELPDLRTLPVPLQDFACHVLMRCHARLPKLKLGRASEAVPRLLSSFIFRHLMRVRASTMPTLRRWHRMLFEDIAQSAEHALAQDEHLMNLRKKYNSPFIVLGSNMLYDSQAPSFAWYMQSGGAGGLVDFRAMEETVRNRIVLLLGSITERNRDLGEFLFRDYVAAICAVTPESGSELPFRNSLYLRMLSFVMFIASATPLGQDMRIEERHVHGILRVLQQIGHRHESSFSDEFADRGRLLRWDFLKFVLFRHGDCAERLQAYPECVEAFMKEFGKAPGATGEKLHQLHAASLADIEQRKRYRDEGQRAEQASKKRKAKATASLAG